MFAVFTVNDGIGVGNARRKDEQAEEKVTMKSYIALETKSVAIYLEAQIGNFVLFEILSFVNLITNRKNV